MSFAPGDRVAVFTGRDYTTIANHGVVLNSVNDEELHTLVFLPHLNAYCLADDHDLLLCERSRSPRVSFAEIVFECCSQDSWSGTFQGIEDYRNTFSFIRSPANNFGFDLSAEIRGKGLLLGKRHLEIRIPSKVELNTSGCLNLLKQILGLEYSKYVEPNRQLLCRYNLEALSREDLSSKAGGR